MGTSVPRKSTIPTAPSGYTLLLEKQGNGPNYPLLNASSAFVPIQGDPGAKPESHKDSKEGMPSPTEQNSNSNNTSSETRSPPADKQDEPEESPHEDLVCASSEYPTLPVADTSSCTTLSGITRKQRRVSPPWNCSTVVEGNGSDSGDSYHGNNSMKLRSSCVGPRARVLSKSDIKRPSRSQSPDSAGELSSVSRHSRESNSPTVSSPNRRVSAASSSSSRRAPNDLQI
ncbi:gap junction alpha-9 protein-like [Scomber scombrus]|uniref:Gap junction alpha-9 protein-like n=2 Tax=Scomber scombrus TaxID=13677 RepID=A0AAV1MQW0_SCOSC